MSLRWAIAPLLLCSALFEPLRNAVHKLGENVGGVGGVGGLTNLWGPDSCNTAAGKADAYCFHEGVVLGLTPFACIFLACWVLPFSVVACLLKPKHLPVNVSQPLTGREQPSLGSEKTGFFSIWASLSMLWFSVPLAMYGMDDFYQQDAYHMILAIAIAAAFPLSWHLSLVAIPAPPFMAELMDMSHKELLAYHKTIAAAAGCWATLHAAGEVIWLISQGSLTWLNIRANGENLIYVCGAMATAVLIVHFAISLIRHKIQSFKQIHRCFAAVLLLVAAAHWWPFTFFLIPAVGVHATSVALKHLAVQEFPATSCTGKVLSCATLAATSAAALVWKLRQSYMLSSSAGLSLPFLLPPAALLAGFGAALCISSAAMKLFP